MADPSQLTHGRWTPLGTGVPQSFTAGMIADSIGFPRSLSYIYIGRGPRWPCSPSGHLGVGGTELPTHFQALTSLDPALTRTRRSLGLPHLAGLGLACWEGG